MTITAVAPPLSLLGPQPKPPVYGLLPQLQRLGLHVPGETHWQSGANVWMYPCVTASPFDPCADAGTWGTKDDGDGAGAGEMVNTLAFTAYAPLMCSTISVGDWDSFYDRLAVAFRSVESAAVEAELAGGGAISSPNDHFGDANVTYPAGMSAVTPEVALRWLERAIGGSQRQGIIHAPPEVTAAWRYDELDVRDGVLQTLANGTPVISGPGYIGIHPDLVGAPSSGTSWAYATGAVTVRSGDEIRFSEVESIDRSDNTVVIRVERDYLATFDPCVQAAVLVDWTP